jgi:hypothetical protein
MFKWDLVPEQRPPVERGGLRGFHIDPTDNVGDEKRRNPTKLDCAGFLLSYNRARFDGA